jgi:hypothetical protein
VVPDIDGIDEPDQGPGAEPPEPAALSSASGPDDAERAAAEAESEGPAGGAGG